jgi:SHS2 domain-containing protein
LAEQAFEVVEHTADIGIRVRATDLPNLFVTAAQGLTSLITEPATVNPTETREIRLEAEDRESLLVEWLNELIYLTEAQGIVFAQYEIDEMSDTTLSGRASGEPIDIKKHAPKIHVKACTYHELKVEKTAFGWFAQVIFDI